MSWKKNGGFVAGIDERFRSLNPRGFSVASAFNPYHGLRTQEEWFKRAEDEETFRTKNPVYIQCEEDFMQKMHGWIRDAGYEPVWGKISTPNKYGVALNRNVIISITRMWDGECVYGIDQNTPLSGENTMWGLEENMRENALLSAVHLEDFQNPIFKTGMSKEEINSAIENGSWVHKIDDRYAWVTPTGGASTIGNTLPPPLVEALKKFDASVWCATTQHVFREPVYEYHIPDCMHAYWRRNSNNSARLVELREGQIAATDEFDRLNCVLEEAKEEAAKRDSAHMVMEPTKAVELLKGQIETVHITCLELAHEIAKIEEDMM